MSHIVIATQTHNPWHQTDRGMAIIPRGLAVGTKRAKMQSQVMQGNTPAVTFYGVTMSPLMTKVSHQTLVIAGMAEVCFDEDSKTIGQPIGKQVFVSVSNTEKGKFSFTPNDKGPVGMFVQPTSLKTGNILVTKFHAGEVEAVVAAAMDPEPAAEEPAPKRQRTETTAHNEVAQEAAFMTITAQNRKQLGAPIRSALHARLLEQERKNTDNDQEARQAATALVEQHVGDAIQAAEAGSDENPQTKHLATKAAMRVLNSKRSAVKQRVEAAIHEYDQRTPLIESTKKQTRVTHADKKLIDDLRTITNMNRHELNDVQTLVAATKALHTTDEPQDPATT